MDANFRYVGANPGTGVQPTILVNPDTNAMLVEGATGGGGSGGDASSANQVAGNALLTTIASNTTPGAGGLTDAELRADDVPVSLASVPTHAVTGPLTDAELRATPVPVSGSVAVSGTTVPTGTGHPTSADTFVPTSVVPGLTWRSGFDKVIAANAVDTAWFTLLQTGAGQSVSQASGSLVMASGTTANSESVVRSVRSFAGNLNTRYSATLSQRILQNNFYIELVDVIGDTLAYVINSATSVTVTIPANPFTAQNVGQSMYMGIIAGAAGIPGRFAIASVSGNDVTFTVASWPGSGSGTLSLWGWNYQHILYTSTVATNASFDMQRNGWASGETVATINTTASGHVGTLGVANATGVFADQLSASSIVLELTQRASRVRNIPDETTNLFLQIRSHNGTSNPATTTTFTVGFVEVESYVAQSVQLTSIGPQSLNTGLPVIVANTPATTISSGTVTTVTTLTGTTTLTPGVAAANLGKAEDAAHASGDTAVAVWGVRYEALTAPCSAAADYSLMQVDDLGKVVMMPYAPPVNHVQYTSPSAITDTTAVAAFASGGAGVRNYVTGFTAVNTSAVASLIEIRDNATVIFRDYLAATSRISVTFPTPLKGTAATAVNVALATTATSTHVSLVGFRAL